MSELSDLYQEVILDHNKNPRNFREIATATQTADGNNPLCGDALRVYVEMEDDKVKTRAEAEVLFGEFQRMVTGELDAETDENHLGRLKIFAGVLEFPARVKCASLSWHTLHAALHGEEIISTE
jgi:nitrogen fixation NifU-like protein